MPREIYEFDNVQLIFRNFEGRGDKFNKEGNANFSIILTEDQAVELADKMINVKRTKPKDGSEGVPYVKISLGQYDPEIYFLKDDKKKILPKAHYAKLDRTEIEFASLEASKSNKMWESNGKQGYSLYLESLVVKFRESRLLSRYADYDEEDEIPFD